MLALLHRFLLFFLAIGQQSMNLVVGVVADRVNLRTEFPSRILDAIPVETPIWIDGQFLNKLRCCPRN
jgi:hypothetical protein